MSGINTPPVAGGRTLQCFSFRLVNSGGTLQHLFGRAGVTNTPNANMAKINGAVDTPATTTPTGTDSSTAMAGGCKISSAVTNGIVFDIPDQVDVTGGFLLASILKQTVDAAGLTVAARLSSRNINGVTRVRMDLLFYDHAGANFVLNTTNIPSAALIEVDVLCFLA